MRFEALQQLELPERSESLAVPVISAARLDGDQALAISHCDPGQGLDLTRGLEIWVRVSWASSVSSGVSSGVASGVGSGLSVLAGEGIGTIGPGGVPCLSAFARELLDGNLLPLLPPGRGLIVEPVLPRGRELAQRTSNAAFGVVDGLALIGMQAEVQRSADPDQLRTVLDELSSLAAAPQFQGDLVLVIGENGLDLSLIHI